MNDDLQYDEHGTPIRDVHSRKDGRHLIRLEYYHDVDPTRPEAYHRFTQRLVHLQDEYDSYVTFVVDSLTFMEFAARNHDQFRGTRSKHGEKAYGAAKDAIERLCFGRLASVHAHNVVVIAHVDETRDDVHGSMIRNPAAPGKLSKRLPAGFSEMYRAYVKRDTNGARQYLLQTEADGNFNASTQIPAPDDCEPDYNALWLPGQAHDAIHVIVYGDAGAKKSTFAATFPKPMLVFMWDPFGKDGPYLRRGVVGAPPEAA